MAKLFFRYSAMDAGKTLDIIKVAFNYKDRGQHTLILNSILDNRAGVNTITSRAGFSNEAISVNNSDNIFDLVQQQLRTINLSCILIDEIHFFTVQQIDQITDIVDYLKIPVICYGLRTDYCGRQFAAAAKLLAIADTIEELKTICFCGKKATYNMLVKDNVAIKQGEAFIADDDNLKQQNIKYISVCRLHWKEGKFK